MARHKRHTFHCQKCNSELEIFKRGKSHRVMVCPNCGIIATNPTVLGKVLKRAGRGVLGEIPGASLLMEGAGLAGDLTRSKTTSTESPRRRLDTGLPSKSERIINKELYGEG